MNTQGLQVGSYHDVVRVTSSAGNTDVQIALLVEASGSILGVNVVGLRFPARQGAGSANQQAIKVLDLGDSSSTVNWTADLLSGSDWLSLSPASGTATPSTPGVLNLTPNQASGQLPAGSRYALVRISDSHSLNSPQYVVAVLDIQSSTSPPLPDPSPAGLFFTALAGGTATLGQVVTVKTSSNTAVAFQASASTTDGGTWLKLSTAFGSSTTLSPGTVVVSVDPSKLTAGIYTGGREYFDVRRSEDGERHRRGAAVQWDFVCNSYRCRCSRCRYRRSVYCQQTGDHGDRSGEQLLGSRKVARYADRATQ